MQSLTQRAVDFKRMENIQTVCSKFVANTAIQRMSCLIDQINTVSKNIELSSGGLEKEVLDFPVPEHVSPDLLELSTAIEPFFKYLDDYYGTKFVSNGNSPAGYISFCDFDKKVLHQIIQALDILGDPHPDLFFSSRHALNTIGSYNNSYTIYNNLFSVVPQTNPKLPTYLNLILAIEYLKKLRDDLHIQDMPDICNNADHIFSYSPDILRGDEPGISSCLQVARNRLNTSKSEGDLFFYQLRKLNFKYMSDDQLYLAKTLMANYLVLRKINESFSKKERARELLVEFDEILGSNYTKENAFSKQVEKHSLFSVLNAIRENPPRATNDLSYDVIYDYFDNLIK